MYKWLDGRTVLPYSLGLAYILLEQPGLLEKPAVVKGFYTLYIKTTALVWPTEWDDSVRMLRYASRVLVTDHFDQEKIPLVDANLQPLRTELIASIAEVSRRERIEGRTKIQREKIECFPFDVRLVSGNLSSLLQASYRSRQKLSVEDGANEAYWRHDHDQLLFDFFDRGSESLLDTAERSEDPSARLLYVFPHTLL